MNQVSPVLRRAVGRYIHWCPACEQMHPLPDSWTFNGNMNKPTFTPSFAQTFVRWTGGINASGLGIGEKQHVLCHYIITDGQLRFCEDSWHKRTDIVAMPLIPPHVRDEFGVETQD